ncbi:hypothetical protein NL676_022290 [Syzygium grande]|nr:hypothetical protein NL676_022290 [Syzygium grande]
MVCWLSYRHRYSTTGSRCVRSVDHGRRRVSRPHAGTSLIRGRPALPRGLDGLSQSPVTAAVTLEEDARRPSSGRRCA